MQCSHMQLHLHVVSVTAEHKQKAVYGLLLTTSIWENVALYKTGNNWDSWLPSGCQSLGNDRNGEYDVISGTRGKKHMFI